jgi:hypothetical protein
MRAPMGSGPTVSDFFHLFTSLYRFPFSLIHAFACSPRTYLRPYASSLNWIECSSERVSLPSLTLHDETWRRGRADTFAMTRGESQYQHFRMSTHQRISDNTS